MKKMIFVATGILTFLLAVSFLMFSLSSSKKVASSESSQNTPMPPSYSYLVKEYEGKIAVFEEDTNEPFRVTTVPVDELPEPDRRLLAKGIVASNLNDLNEILEDYCS